MPRRYVGRSNRTESTVGFLEEDEESVDILNVLEPQNKRNWSEEFSAGEAESSKRRSVIDSEISEEPPQTPTSEYQGVPPRAELTTSKAAEKMAELTSSSSHPMVTRRRSLMESELSDILSRNLDPTPLSVVSKRRAVEDMTTGEPSTPTRVSRTRRSTVSEIDATAILMRNSIDIDEALKDSPESGHGSSAGGRLGPARRRRSSIPMRPVPYMSSPKSVTPRGGASDPSRWNEKSPRGEVSGRSSVREKITHKIDYVTSTLKDLEFTGLKRPGSRKINPVYTDPRFEAEVMTNVETPKKKNLFQSATKKVVKSLSKPVMSSTMSGASTPDPRTEAPVVRKNDPMSPTPRRIRRRSKSVPNIVQHWTGAGPVKDSVLVSVGTWNMNGKSPTCSIAPMVEPDKYHVYVVGTEECEQKAKSVRMVSKKRWEQKIEETLGQDYVKLASKAMQGIHIVCFVRRDVYMRITDVQTGSVGTGLGNFYGNKGAVAISFQLQGTTFLFISTHLAAHQDEVSARNANFWKINRELSLTPKSFPGMARNEEVVERFHRVFWMGDLNYRVNMTREGADECLSTGHLAVMFEQDQLAREMREGRVFPNFHEGRISFPPTYKFDIDSDVYDSSEKQRVPSWTDRILSRQCPAVRQLDYRAVLSMKTSDHRPVCATYLVDIDQFAD